ncbi:glycine cleavage system aminomethyltransferase GcvT [bacterium]|nr:glycine cleavage system aminomethyltransferase GcvT [bacterium]
MKRTPLYNEHVKLGGKMVPFAGYEMPVQYSGLREEHLAVRSGVGIFDVSHMGEFMVTGHEAEALVSWICSNAVHKIDDFQAQYNCMPNKDGGIVDDLIVYRFNPNKYMLVVNASNEEKDWKWINDRIEEKGFDCQIENQSEHMSLIAVQGPTASDLVQKLTDTDCSAIKFYHFAVGTVAGVEDVIISGTGYTGSGGFELYVKNADAVKVWNALLQEGESMGIRPCGLGARDTLRLEKGYCLYGNDIDDTTSPLEAGLGWITKFSEPFVHMEYHQKLKEDGVKRKLVGFEMIDKGIPRQLYVVVNEEGEKIGEVTSGTQSPSLNKAIGMAYVQPEYSKAGTEIYIQIRNKTLKAEVAKIPFL